MIYHLYWFLSYILHSCGENTDAINISCMILKFCRRDHPKGQGYAGKNNINGIYKNYRACRYFRHLGPGCDRDERHVVENIGSTNISDTLEQGGLKKFRHIIYIYFL